MPICMILQALAFDLGFSLRVGACIRVPQIRYYTKILSVITVAIVGFGQWVSFYLWHISMQLRLPFLLSAILIAADVASYHVCVRTYVF